MIYREGQKQTHVNEISAAEQEALAEEYMLPTPKFYAESEDGTVSPGWELDHTRFNEDTLQQETTLKKGEDTIIVPTDKLDELQMRMIEANSGLRSKMGGNVLEASGVEAPTAEVKHITVIDPEGAQPPQTIVIRH